MASGSSIWHLMYTTKSVLDYVLKAARVYVPLLLRQVVLFWTTAAAAALTSASFSNHSPYTYVARSLGKNQVESCLALFLRGRATEKQLLTFMSTALVSSFVFLAGKYETAFHCQARAYQFTTLWCEKAFSRSTCSSINVCICCCDCIYAVF